MAVTGEKPPEILTMTWNEALDRFGTDKPDLRFAMELVSFPTPSPAPISRLSADRRSCGPSELSAEGDSTRSRLDCLVERARQLGAAGLVWMRVQSAAVLESPVAKFLSEDHQRRIVAATGAEPGDLLLIVAGDRGLSSKVLGQLRLDLGQPPGERQAVPLHLDHRVPPLRGASTTTAT